MNIKRVGVIGSGQLGRMMALAGTPLNVEFVFYDSAYPSPSSRLGETINPNDKGSLERFIDSVDVVTYESENTDVSLVEYISTLKPVYPGADSLRKSQHRLTEKQAFRSLGIETAPFCAVRSYQEALDAASQLGYPFILKTTTEGYDGKGQALVKSSSDLSEAWEQLGDKELIAEGFVKFTRELSIIAVRDANGNTKSYPLAENEHRDGILRVSRVPAQNVSLEKQKQAERYATEMLDHLGHVGVLTIELFDTENGLVANEMAPRVHNSGHWSIEGAYCSQFENHVRAICDLPLGSTETCHSFSAMINVIGRHGNSNQVLETPNQFLHYYSKSERAHRKIGHINTIASSIAELEESISSLQSFIEESGE